MIVLGIHRGHDSSCAVVKDGKIIADAAEERFVRNKHSANVPVNALQYCLRAAGLKDINDFDLIASGWNKTPAHLAVLLGLQHSNIKKDLAKRLLNYAGIGMGAKELKPPIYLPNYRIADQGKFLCIEHHLAHAASAHYTRANSEKCLVFTIDGRGDGVCTAVWLAEGNSIKPLQKLHTEAAIGWAYSVVTEALHWWHGDGVADPYQGDR